VRRAPIRAWQIWNEPAATYQWSDQPFAADYVALVKAARVAIRAADPRGTVVLAGLANFSWQDLASIYRVAGARQAFDAVAVHAYTGEAPGVITILGRVRVTMRRYGDRRKPMVATEVGWPATVGRMESHFGFETTNAGQAARIRALLPLLARHRRRLGLSAFFLYTWLGSDVPGGTGFQFAGLRRVQRAGPLQTTPAFAAFVQAARKLEAR
jgi:hypothetical protein